MPILFKYRGLAGYMYFKDIEKHHLPHFHVEYGDFEASFDLNGNLLAGKLPTQKYKDVKKITNEYQLLLQHAWEKALIGDTFDKLPLRK